VIQTSRAVPCSFEPLQSPAEPLARRLLSWGADLSYHDPHVPSWSLEEGALTSVEDVYEACAVADIVVLLQPHAEYDLGRLVAESRLILDTRGVLQPADSVSRL
jgi:UDP-N-acetyl-D-mannosaminuronate dehydrogenase